MIGYLKKYLNNGLLVLVPPVVTFLITFITLPIVLNSISPEDYGKLQLILAIQVFAIALSASHITTGLKASIAKGFEGTFLYAYFYRLKLISPLFLVGIASFVVLYALGHVTLSILILIISFYSLIGWLANVSYINYFIATKKFKAKAIWEVVSNLLALALAATVIYYTKNIILFAITQYSLMTLISLLGFFYVIKKNKLWLKYKNGNIDKKCINYGLKLIPSNLVSVIGNKISSVVVSSLWGYSNLSFFQVANNLRDQMAVVPRLISPLLYSDFAKSNKKELLSKIKARLFFLFFISSAFTVITMLAGYYYIDLFLPAEYQGSKTYFLILCSIFPFSIVSFLLDTVLQSQLMHRELNIINISLNILKIVLIIIGGLAWGVVGICSAITLNGWIGFFVYYLILFKRKS